MKTLRDCKNKEEVREEGIKSIKAMRDGKIGHNDFFYKKETTDIENWIKHFLNIEEQDLK